MVSTCVRSDSRIKDSWSLTGWSHSLHALLTTPSRWFIWTTWDHSRWTTRWFIDAFSRWIELFPTTSVSAYETASCLFGTPSAIHTDRWTAFQNDWLRSSLYDHGPLLRERTTLCPRHIQRNRMVSLNVPLYVLRHLTNSNPLRHQSSNAWSYEQFPMVQRIMNTVELVLTNSIRLRYLASPSASNNWN